MLLQRKSNHRLLEICSHPMTLQSSHDMTVIPTFGAALYFKTWYYEAAPLFLVLQGPTRILDERSNCFQLFLVLQGPTRILDERSNCFQLFLVLQGPTRILDERSNCFQLSCQLSIQVFFAKEVCKVFNDLLINNRI